MNTKQNIINNPAFIGNDIVSLMGTDNIKSFSNEKYLKKILNQTELAYYLQSEYKSVIPPLFWSCKESAYKILLQKGLKNSFSPKLFHVDLKSFKKLSIEQFAFAETQCHYEDITFFCRSSVENDFIHTYACLNEETFENVVIRTERLEKITPENQSDITYKLLQQCISEYYLLKYSDLSIIKDIDGAPAIYLNSELLNIPFSVSHDDNYIGFVFLKNKKPILY